MSQSKFVIKEKLPETVVIGKLDELDDALSKLDVHSTLLLVTGSGPTKQIGQDAKEKITQHEVIGPFEVENASWAEAKKIASAAEKYNVDFLLGLGGGKVGVDVKLGAHLSSVPLIYMPSTPTNDGLDSTLVSVRTNNVPESVIVEPYRKIISKELHYNAPLKQVMSGAGDIIAKLTSVLDWKLATEMGMEPNTPYDKGYAKILKANAHLILNNFDEIRKSGTHFNRSHPMYRKFVDNLLYSAVEAGKIGSILKSSRPLSGSEHLYAHGLDSIYSELNLENPLLHGEGCIPGTITGLHLHGEEWKKLYNLLACIGYKLKNSTPDEYKIEALIRAKRIGEIRGRYTILNKYNLSEKKSRRILSDVHLI